MCVQQCQGLYDRMENEWVDIALRYFLRNHGNIETERSPKPGLCPTLIWKDKYNSAMIYLAVWCTS